MNDKSENMTALKSLKKVAYAQGAIDESMNRENCETFLEFPGHIGEALTKHYQKGREDYRAMENGEIQKSEPDDFHEYWDEMAIPEL